MASAAVVAGVHGTVILVDGAVGALPAVDADAHVATIPVDAGTAVLTDGRLDEALVDVLVAVFTCGVRNSRLHLVQALSVHLHVLVAVFTGGVRNSGLHLVQALSVQFNGR